MDTFDCIRTKLDVREFDSARKVPVEDKAKILEAARLTGSGMNSQHWRFVLVQTPERLKTLADDSSTGSWVRGANFAVIVLTPQKYGFELIDAGRALQDMQLAAWNLGIVSCIYTGFKETAMRKDFSIPEKMVASVVVGFGYPTKKLTGTKNRKSVSDLVFIQSYGKPYDEKELA